MNILWYERVEFSEFIQNGLEAVTHLTADPGRELQLQAFTSHIGHDYVFICVLGTGKHTHTHTQGESYLLVAALVWCCVLDN